jgi:alpha-L-fucosidase
MRFCSEPWGNAAKAHIALRKKKRSRVVLVKFMSLFCAISVVSGGISHATAADAQSTGPAAPSSIPYATQQTIEPGDSDAVIAEKAAKVLPRPNQTAWMRLQRTFFLHFGPNTFRGVEWGSGQEDPSVFNPTDLDADQWLQAVQDGGGKQLILVCKHHDGFCLWPTRYTTHSVVASPWRGGRGDEVREVADAARRHGIQLGVYLSPADLYQLRTNPVHPGGYYGDGSSNVPSTIPTDTAQFLTDPTQGRTPPHGRPQLTYTVDDYNRYFLNQLYELLTEYGPISEVWFDGANPDSSVHQTYDYAAWYDLIRRLQPQAVIAVKGPDVRWVGNEGGVGRTTEWSVIPLSRPPDQFSWPDMTEGDLGGREKLVPGSTLWWYPAEVNIPILYGWFWASRKGVRTAADLVNSYYQSVGRNGNWLLNLSPDTRGRIPDDQLASLRGMAQVIQETFARNLADGGTLTADSSAPGHVPALALDGHLDTWWEAASGQTAVTLTLTLPRPVTFDVVSLQEAVDHRGQRIESFDVDVWGDGQWRSVDQQTTDRVRLRITASRLEPTLAEVGLYKQAPLVSPPVLFDRTRDGRVTITSPQGLPVVYTTDGSAPTPHSTVYQNPLALPLGGTVNATCLGPDGRLGMLASRTFYGYAPAGWMVVAEDGQGPGPASTAARAIDGDPATVWIAPATPEPHSLTIELGRMLRIGGFTYLPRQDSQGNGVVEQYMFETSLNGISWTVVVAQGRFDNIRNNPVLQVVPFAPITARFVRFTGLRDVSGTGAATAAELSVLPPPR